MIKEKNIAIEPNEENILTYALFPEVGIQFFENKDNSEFFESAPLEFTQDKDNFYKVLINESEYLVKYSKTGEPEIFDENDSIKKDMSNSNPVNDTGVVIKAPLSGNIFKIIKNENENLVLDDTVIVLEAMKMETTIKTPVPGKVLKIFVKNGDKVSAGDPLFEVAE